MKFFGLALLLALMSPDGCDQAPIQRAAPTSKPRLERRFDPVSDGRGNGSTDFALDTYTGILCRTWLWEDTTPNPKSRREWAKGIPLCTQLAVIARSPDDSKLVNLLNVDSDFNAWQEEVGRAH
jgi:hypothetical protein